MGIRISGWGFVLLHSQKPKDIRIINWEWQVSEVLFNYLNYKHILSDKTCNGDDGDWNGILDESLRSCQWLVQLTYASISLSIKKWQNKTKQKNVICFGFFSYIGELTFHVVSTQEIILTMIWIKKWSLSEMSLWFCCEESYNVSHTNDLN